MKNLKLVLLLPVLLIITTAMGCDNDGTGNANAQPSPMSGTDATGTINAPSAQTCPADIMIEGLKTDDVVILEIDATGAMTAEATITNSTSGTSAKCSGMTDGPLPAEVMGCDVSSSSIDGIAVTDKLELSVAFSSQDKGLEFVNTSGSTGLECAFATLETLNVN